ncbi:hemophore-related protein [Mycobacterium sp.]|uniref:hemophore-related protein n=1 Tax=Mycobacterium sp. TaxID=1785 RepID=UPI002D88960D|nr:hemophore-related protein [Mycobacterium sp.]
MKMFSSTKLVVAVGGLGLAFTTGIGIASAQPDVNPIINSTCTYPQVIAALNAQSPELAGQLEQTPAANGWLKSLIAASPDQRRVMVAQAQAFPGVQQYTPVITQVANTCNNF